MTVARGQAQGSRGSQRVLSGAVLVSSDCFNKTPWTGTLKQETCISRSSGGMEVQDQDGWVVVKTLFLVNRHLSSC